MSRSRPRSPPRRRACASTSPFPIRRRRRTGSDVGSAPPRHSRERTGRSTRRRSRSCCSPPAPSREPKAVMHTEQTANFAARNVAGSLGLGDDDVVWMPSPIGHSTGLNYGVRVALYHGIPLVLQDRWDGGAAAELVARWRCTLHARRDDVRAGPRRGRARRRRRSVLAAAARLRRRDRPARARRRRGGAGGDRAAPLRIDRGPRRDLEPSRRRCRRAASRPTGPRSTTWRSRFATTTAAR